MLRVHGALMRLGALTYPESECLVYGVNYDGLPCCLTLSNKLGFAANVTLATQANLAVMQTFQEEIGIIEKRLMARVKLHPDYALLNSVPGIGPVLATTIMLETGTISRFTKVGNFSSYCRCVDSRRESNSRKKGEANTKNGNKYLAWAFVEAANFAIRSCPEAKRFYERKKLARNSKRRPSPVSIHDSTNPAAASKVDHVCQNPDTHFCVKRFICLR